MCKLQCALFAECVAVEYATADQRCSLVGSNLRNTGSLAGALKAGTITGYVREHGGTGTSDKITKVVGAQGYQCLAKTGGKPGVSLCKLGAFGGLAALGP